MENHNSSEGSGKKTGIPKWRKILYCAIFLTLGVIALIPGGTAAFRKKVLSLLPVPRPYELLLSPDPKTRGREQGEKFRWQILFLDKLYIRYFTSKEKFPWYLEQAAELFQKMDPRWTMELMGMAETSGVHLKTLMLGNCFLDMGLNASGCRQILVKGNNGLLHSHNLDWDNLGGIGNYLVTIFRSTPEPGRFRTVHLGFPGMIGVLDIINEHGIALSFDQVGISNGETGLPVFIAMRDIAETCDTFEKAESYIRKMPPGMPFCLGVSDAKNGKMAVFEREFNDSKVFRRLPINGILTADNSIWGANHTKHHTVDLVTREKNPRTPSEIQELLRHPKIMLGCNIYSLIFDYHNNCFYLASGTVPAAEGIFRKFPLF